MPCTDHKACLDLNLFLPIKTQITVASHTQQCMAYNYCQCTYLCNMHTIVSLQMQSLTGKPTQCISTRSINPLMVSCSGFQVTLGAPTVSCSSLNSYSSFFHTLIIVLRKHIFDTAHKACTFSEDMDIEIHLFLFKQPSLTPQVSFMEFSQNFS